MNKEQLVKKYQRVVATPRARSMIPGYESIPYDTQVRFCPPNAISPQPPPIGEQQGPLRSDTFKNTVQPTVRDDT